MLKFSLEEIPESGLETGRDLDREWLQPLMGPQFFPGPDPLRVEYRVVRAGNTVMAHGRLGGQLGFVCSRCAEEATFTVGHSYNHLFVEGREASSVPSPEDEDDDADGLDVTFFSGETVDLEPLTAEELVLSLPPVPLCAETCKGICQGCGKNLNEGPCECHADVVDPRWGKLREIKL